jgi:hypothetical protein
MVDKEKSAVPSSAKSEDRSTSNDREPQAVAGPENKSLSPLATLFALVMGVPMGLAFVFLIWVLICWTDKLFSIVGNLLGAFRDTILGTFVLWILGCVGLLLAFWTIRYVFFCLCEPGYSSRVPFTNYLQASVEAMSRPMTEEESAEYDNWKRKGDEEEERKQKERADIEEQRWQAAQDREEEKRRHFNSY